VRPLNVNVFPSADILNPLLAKFSSPPLQITNPNPEGTVDAGEPTNHYFPLFPLVEFRLTPKCKLLHPVPSTSRAILTPSPYATVFGFIKTGPLIITYPVSVIPLFATNFPAVNYAYVDDVPAMNLHSVGIFAFAYVDVKPVPR
jgi:hypothetical protein